jgi:hypothetical protein
MISDFALTDSQNSSQNRTAAHVPDPVRMDLKEPLAGHTILVDLDQVTLGLVEDFQSGMVATLLDQLARVVVGGDLIRGDVAERRQLLRTLPMRQVTAIINGVTESLRVPNAS